MKMEIKVPKMGESVVEATIGTILKPSGSAVKADEEILELETEKVNQVLYAPAAGQLQLTVKKGDVVKVDQVIGTVDAAAAPAPEKPLEKSKSEPKAPASAPPIQAAAPAPKPKPELPAPQTSAAPIRKKADESLSELRSETARPALSLPPSVPSAPPPA